MALRLLVVQWLCIVSGPHSDFDLAMHVKCIYLEHTQLYLQLQHLAASASVDDGRQGVFIYDLLF